MTDLIFTPNENENSVKKHIVNSISSVGFSL